MNPMTKFGGLIVLYLLSSSVCSNNVTDDFLIIADLQNGVIWQRDLITRRVHAIYSQCNNPASASYDPIEQRVYWTEILTFAKIRRVNIDGTEPGTVFNFTYGSVPEIVTVDHISRLLYYTEGIYSSVGVMQMDGSQHKILIRADKPRGITLDPINGWMYWTDWGAKPMIERAHMDGENRQTVANTDLIYPNGIDIDIPEQKLYWCDGSYSRIETSDPNGSNRVPLIKAGDSVGGRYYDIAVDGQQIYFTDFSFDGKWSYHKYDGGNVTVESVDSIPSAKLRGVGVYRSSYNLSGSNGCSVNNGGCPYLCLPKPNGRTCASPDGYSECVSTTTDKPTTDIFLIFADLQNGVIWQRDLITRTVNAIYSQCTNPSSASYDPIEQRVYWTEIFTFAKIRRVNINGTEPDTVFNFPYGSEPETVTVDHISRLLYYTEGKYSTIGVMRMDGSQHNILVRADKPRGITLDPFNGWMYWTDWGIEPKIERAHMDGGNRQTVADAGLKFPNGIDIDIHEQKLYWCDAFYSRIETSDTDGSNRRSLIKAEDTVGGRYYDIAVDGQQIYFTDFSFDGLWSYHKYDSSKFTVESNDCIPSAKLRGVRVYRSSYNLSGSNGCSLNNGGCPYLCLPKPNGRTCACLDGGSECISTTTDTSSTTVKEVRVKTDAVVKASDSTSNPLEIIVPVSSSLAAVILVVVIILVFLKSRRTPPPDPQSLPRLNPTFHSGTVPAHSGTPEQQLHLSQSSIYSIYDTIPSDYGYLELIGDDDHKLVTQGNRTTPPDLPHPNPGYYNGVVPALPGSPEEQLRLSVINPEYDNTILGGYQNLITKNVNGAPNKDEDYDRILPGHEMVTAP